VMDRHIGQHGMLLKKSMKKIKDIKLRVPEEYLEPIKEHAE